MYVVVKKKRERRLEAIDVCLRYSALDIHPLKQLHAATPRRPLAPVAPCHHALTP